VNAVASCSFCGIDLPKGSGRLYAKRDGTIFYFCSSKCMKNQLKLGRVGKKIKWAKKTRKA
jgi:large subunit ribosomal protein L24e